MCAAGFRENRGYSSFEDFLGDLKQSKRKSIRQVRSGGLAACVAHLRQGGV
jgi:predicted N-acyltransferase